MTRVVHAHDERGHEMGRVDPRPGIPAQHVRGALLERICSSAAATQAHQLISLLFAGTTKAKDTEKPDSFSR
jgi:hypothetical protein